MPTSQKHFWVKMINLLIFKHPVQVPRWDVPRWLPYSIILLKLPPRCQITPPRPINLKVVYLGHIKTLSPVIFGKLLLLNELKYFHQGPRCSATWFLKFRIVSTAMDTGYLVSLVIYTNKTRFFESYLAP